MPQKRQERYQAELPDLPHCARSARGSGCERDWAPAGSFPRQVAQCRGDAGNLEPARRRSGGVLERLRQPAGAPELTVGYLDAQGRLGGAEDRLLVVPPDPTDLDAMVPAGGSAWRPR
jgi:hypothetical protein